MAGTVNLPQQTFDPAHGPYLFGPQSVAPNDSLILLSIDRTPAGGLNSLPASALLEYIAEQSNDGGATWFVAVGGAAPGGQMFNAPPPRNDGALITASTARVTVYGSGPGRQLRARITASGSVIVAGGTLTIS
jgi:hypothetical protein